MILALSLSACLLQKLTLKNLRFKDDSSLSLCPFSQIYIPWKGLKKPEDFVSPWINPGLHIHVRIHAHIQDLKHPVEVHI